MTYYERDYFNTHEVHNVRKAFKNISETIPELGLEMCCDGSIVKTKIVKKKIGTVFQFKTRGFSLCLAPMWVKHKKKEPAVQVSIRNLSQRNCDGVCGCHKGSPYRNDFCSCLIHCSEYGRIGR